MDKHQLRQILKQKRASFSPEQKKEFDHAIVQNIAALECFQKASMLLLFAPVRGEINLLALARIARRMGKPIAFPRCNTADNTMNFYILTEDSRLVTGAYNIPEPPANAPLCIPDERALCILPGLSFDPTGNRLGYGKGYYDRYLANFPGVTVGALYAEMMLRQIPADPHDMAVEYLVTERGSFAALPTQLPPKSDRPHSNTKSNSKVFTQSKITGTLKQMVDTVRTHVSTETQGTPALTKKIPLHKPPILVLITFVLLAISRLVEPVLLDRDNEYISVVLLQILIFLLPAFLYCKIRGEAFVSRTRLTAPRPEHILLLLSMLFIIITGSLLTSILTGGIEILSGNFTLYSTFVAHMSDNAEIAYSIIAYALLPALGEELIFRSILCAEYEAYGVGVSITVSALFFAMLHFSLPLFLTYFLVGILLAFTMYATRSLFAPIILHFFYNVFCLFGQPYLSAFYVNAGNTEIFLFCLIVIFLLFAAFAAGEARKIYHSYAKKNADASYTTSLPLKHLPQALFYALRSPVTLACILLWLTVTVITLL